MIIVEKVPRRIVLSRKGFDSSAGGCASPIVDGVMISLPIPEHNQVTRASRLGAECEDRHLTYREMKSSQGKKISSYISQLTGGKIRPSDCVHLDPDIRPALRNPESVAWPLTFGQNGGSQTELVGLSEGDLFLFFGWFREAYESGEEIRFTKHTADIHAIWGWLHIGQKLHLPNDLVKANKLAPHHPHVSHHLGRVPNCLYVASQSLTFLPGCPGAGAFPLFHDGLRLSDKQSKSRPRKQLRSHWSLPAFFKNIGMTHHPGLPEWTTEGDRICGKGGAYPGQEFVFETRGYESEVAGWLTSIFRKQARKDA